ncbi:MAG: alpha/beta fold hydrolase [Planctomycetota bacterium]
MYRSELTLSGNRRRRLSGWAMALVVLLVAAGGGCASAKYATLRPVPKSPLVERLHLTSRSGPQASDRTQQFLRVYDLAEDEDDDPRRLLEKVQEIIGREPSADKVYSFAELAYLEAKKAEDHDPQLALDLYGASVLYAHQYLFDERFRYLRNPYDPQFRSACDLYNGALEAGLRIVCQDDGLVPGHTYTISTTAGDWDISCELRGGPWRNEDFDRFEFVSDYEIRGLKNHYHTYGLGVPLIAVRRGYEGEPAAAKYYPPDLSFPVTAFLRPIPGTGPAREGRPAHHRGVLEIYDSATTTDVAVGNVRVPLESDLSTPLAYFLSRSDMASLATAGLLRPDLLLAMRPGQSEPVMGLYMVQPYEPGKIPVLFVHGLWSSPMTWMQMFNDLRASPEILENYQFWFYLYPSGEPFWRSAAQMRRDLAEVRKVVDPYRQEPALDQMVLVGHSMGGLVSRLQTVDSGDDFWKIVSDQPFHLIQAKPKVRKELEQSLFFQPNPSIRRVVTIGTPHRGSRFSNLTTQWISSKLIRLPRMLVLSQQALFRDNKDLIRDDTLLKIENSIDSLDPNSPFFPVMLAAHSAPWVKYHNVIGLVPERGLIGKLAAGSDGVVTYESAAMDDVESELKVPSDHMLVHAHPRAVLEVKRVLLEHLAELRSPPGYGPSRVRTATRLPR